MKQSERMWLEPVPGPTAHISYFHQLVSAYEMNEETLGDLVFELDTALVQAKAQGREVVVDQDSLDHVFIVFPSGRVGLYCRVGMYEVKREV